MKYPTCNFTLKNVQSVSDLISRKLRKRGSLSLIRLGDGEGLLLSISGQSPELDRKYLEKHLGPRGIDLEDLLHLRNRLIQSIKSADIIGIRDDIIDVVFNPEHFLLTHVGFLREFRKSFKLREVEKSLELHGTRRIAFLHKNLGDLNLNNDTHFCSAWLHYDLHTSGAIFRILRQQERIGLISCRLNLPGLLKELFGVSVRFHEIPDRFCDISQNQIPPDYIGRLENVLNQQLVEFSGMLYLVGGGLYGKLYCQLIELQGGIALDLGSLFDAWLGIPTRPAIYQSMFGMRVKGIGVPSELFLTTENIDSLVQAEP